MRKLQEPKCRAEGWGGRERGEQVWLALGDTEMRSV